MKPRHGCWQLQPRALLKRQSKPKFPARVFFTSQDKECSKPFDSVLPIVHTHPQPHAPDRFEPLPKSLEEPSLMKMHRGQQGRGQGRARDEGFQQAGGHIQGNENRHNGQWRSFEGRWATQTFSHTQGGTMNQQYQWQSSQIRLQNHNQYATQAQFSHNRQGGSGFSTGQPPSRQSFDSFGPDGAPGGVPVNTGSFSQSTFQSFHSNGGNIGSQTPLPMPNLSPMINNPPFGPGFFPPNPFPFNFQMPSLGPTHFNPLVAPGGMFATGAGPSFPISPPMFTPSPHFQQQAQVFPPTGAYAPYQRVGEPSQPQGFVTEVEEAAEDSTSDTPDVREGQVQESRSPAMPTEYVAPPPTEEYLAQASRQPRKLTRSQPLLVVLDLNGTILFRRNRKYPPQFTPRPGLQHFLDMIFKRYKVMVWSSARPVTVDAICNKIFSKKERRKLLAEWGRDKLNLSPAQYAEKVQVYKRLDQIWVDESLQAKYPTSKKETSKLKYVNGAGQDAANQKNPPSPNDDCSFTPTLRWDQTNTVLIDDSKLKAASQPFNILEVPEFTKESSEQEQEANILKLVLRRLNALSKVDDVSCLIRHWDLGAQQISFGGGVSPSSTDEESESSHSVSEGDMLEDAGDDEGGEIQASQTPAANQKRVASVKHRERRRRRDARMKREAAKTAAKHASEHTIRPISEVVRKVYTNPPNATT